MYRDVFEKLYAIGWRDLESFLGSMHCFKILTLAPLATTFYTDNKNDFGWK